jgi:hypothetical protein
MTSRGLDRTPQTQPFPRSSGRSKWDLGLGTLDFPPHLEAHASKTACKVGRRRHVGGSSRSIDGASADRLIKVVPNTKTPPNLTGLIFYCDLEQEPERRDKMDHGRRALRSLAADRD